MGDWQRLAGNPRLTETAAIDSPAPHPSLSLPPLDALCGTLRHPVRGSDDWFTASRCARWLVSAVDGLCWSPSRPFCWAARPTSEPARSTGVTSAPHHRHRPDVCEGPTSKVKVINQIYGPIRTPDHSRSRGRGGCCCPLSNYLVPRKTEHQCFVRREAVLRLEPHQPPVDREKVCGAANQVLRLVS